jgi:hypothetical protein
MRTKTILLHSVSAIATMAAAAGVVSQAQAQVLATGDDGYTFSVQGGLLFSPAEQTLAGLDKMGSGIFQSGDPSIGYNAAFSVGKQIDENWDVRFGGSINKLLESTVGSSFGSADSYYSPGLGSGFESGFYSGIFEIAGRGDFAFEALDFEVGYSPVLQDDLSVRLFAGIRALHYSSRGGIQFGGSFASGSSFSAGFGSGFTSSFSEYGFAYNGAFETEFFGAGPRVGISAAHRFAGTNWGLSGTVAGAALFGRQTFRATQSYSADSYSSYYTSSGGVDSGATSGSYSGGSASSFSSTDSTDKLVFDLQVKGGVDFYLDDKTALTFGYQAEQLFGVGVGEDSETNKLVHGPFISLTGAL